MPVQNILTAPEIIAGAFFVAVTALSTAFTFAVAVGYVLTREPAAVPEAAGEMNRDTHYGRVPAAMAG